MPRVKINSISLYCEIDGSGSSIVFINGLTMDTNGWTFQIPTFAKRHKVIRYDCRGQGQSDKPDAVYSQEMHADDLKKLIDKLGVNKCHLLGLSNGGMVAQHFTLKYPDRVAALVLVDTCSYIDTMLDSIVRVWIKATEIGGSELRYDATIPFIFSETFIKNNQANISAMKQHSVEVNPPNATINLAKACLNHNVTKRLSEIKAPTLIIVGEEDILVPLRYSRLLNEKITGSKLLIIKQCGHVPTLEKPEEFNKIVLEFLKDNDSLPH